eukprot:247390-Chlamydomonas_euryale.AAC.5
MSNAAERTTPRAAAEAARAGGGRGAARQGWLRRCDRLHARRPPRHEGRSRCLRGALSRCHSSAASRYRFDKGRLQHAGWHRQGANRCRMGRGTRRNGLRSPALQQRR